MKLFKRILVTLAISLIIVLCLASLLLGQALTNLPRKAEQAFGPPAASHNTLQQTILSTELLLQADDLKQPFNPAGTEQPFSVELGESIYEITLRLENDGLIPNAVALRNFLVYAGLDKTLQAGDYVLSPRMTPMEIANAMQNAIPGEVIFQILPGWRVEEIADALPTSGLNFSPDEFLKIASNPPIKFLIPLDLLPGNSLEGFLFPDSYRLSRQVSAEDFFDTLLENFQIKTDNNIRQGFTRQDLNLFQAVVLASIVEREAIIEDEMPIIASVFNNRLASGTKLDSDPTVQYALGFNKVQNTWWTNPLSLDDLQTDSPYNTYLYPGLPPGPIANPGLSALRAVAFPAQTPYYYFRAACDGSGLHNFAETFQEHQENACPP